MRGNWSMHGHFHGRSVKIDRPLGRQKSTATDRLRPTANTICNLQKTDIFTIFGDWKILKFPHCGPPTFLVKAFLFKMKLKVFVNADQTSFGTLEDRIVLTVWKFQDFSVNNIFREIKFCVLWKFQKTT